MLEDAGKLEWGHAAIDSSPVRAIHRGSKTGKCPTDRANAGTNRHVLTESETTVITVCVT
jgi:hypothetical protein